MASNSEDNCNRLFSVQGKQRCWSIPIFKYRSALYSYEHVRVDVITSLARGFEPATLQSASTASPPLLVSTEVEASVV